MLCGNNLNLLHIVRCDTRWQKHWYIAGLKIIIIITILYSTINHLSLHVAQNYHNGDASCQCENLEIWPLVKLKQIVPKFVTAD